MLTRKLNKVLARLKHFSRDRSSRALEKAMHEVALHDNPETRVRLFSAFLKADLIVPGIIGGSVSDKKTQVRFKTIEHPPGKVILPAFTHVDAFKNWSGDSSPWIQMPARAVFECISGGHISEVVVNPFPPGGTLIKPGILILPEFQALGRGLIPKLNTFKERTFEMQGPDGILADPLLASEPLPGRIYLLVAQALESYPQVRAAYHFDIKIGKGNPTPVLAYEFENIPSGDVIQSVMQSVAIKMVEYKDPGFGIDMAVIQKKDLGNIKSKIKPFYERAVL